MAGCCDPNGLCRMFGTRQAEADARSYRRGGLDADAKRIVDFLADRGIAGQTVLEIGGGIGAIQLELLSEGAARSENVEISPAYEDIARALASERGVADRVTRRVADFATDSALAGEADAVIMHKVVCCYPDMPGLLRPAAQHARRWLLLTFPADRWWTRLGMRLVNAWQWLVGNPYRAFVHQPAAMLEILRDAGLEPVLSRRGALWQLLAAERS